MKTLSSFIPPGPRGDGEGETERAAVSGRQPGEADGRHPLPQGGEEDQGAGDVQGHAHPAEPAHPPAQGETRTGARRDGPEHTPPLLGGTWFLIPFCGGLIVLQPSHLRHDTTERGGKQGEKSNVANLRL